MTDRTSRDRRDDASPTQPSGGTPDDGLSTARTVATAEAAGGDVSTARTVVAPGGSERELSTARTVAASMGRTPTVLLPPGGADGPEEEPTLRAEADDGSNEVSLEAAGRYDFRGERDRGGQARVLVAFDRHALREVAWKELLGEETPGSTAPDATTPLGKRFLREARVAAQLEHPNIVPVYEIGRRADGSLYYTMRLVRGESLLGKLDQCRNLRDRLKLLGHFWDLCNAMAFAHERGVVHRDLKPGNVMVGEFGETVLLDWGLAKLRGVDDPRGPELAPPTEAPRPTLLSGGAVDATLVGAALGTPAYMSPEQAGGRIDEIDERSDVWGLGGVLYEILTGRPPYTGRNVAEVVSRVLTEPVPPVRSVCPEAPAELAGIAERALRRERGERYANAGELAADVSAYMTGGRVRAHAYTSWELLRRFAARNKAALAAAAAALVVVIVALVFVFFAWRGESDARTRERSAHLVGQYHLAQAYQQEADRLLGAHQALSARVYALASLLHNPAHPGGADDDPGFAARQPGADSLAVESRSVVYRAGFRRVSAVEWTREMTAPARAVTVSPDGTRVAAGDSGGWVVEWNAADGVERWRVRADGERAMAVAYSADGRRLAATGGTGHVRMFDVRDGAALGELALPGGGLCVAWVGERIAAATVEGRLLLLEPADGRVVFDVPAHDSQIWGLDVTPDERHLVTGSWDGLARVWNAADGSPAATLAGHTDAIYKLVVSRDGRRVVTAGYDGTVRVWALPDGTPVDVYREMPDACYGVAISPDGALVAGAGTDRALYLWDAGSGTLLEVIDAHSDQLPAVAWSSDGRRIVTASHDRTVRSWRVAATDGLRRLPHPDTVLGVSYASDGRHVATAGWDRLARIWDVERGTVVRTLGRHTDGLHGLEYSPDGNRLVTVGYDKLGWLWDVSTGEALAELRGHDAIVASAAWSPDGRRLATGGSKGGLVLLWDGRTGAPRGELHVAGTVVFGMAFLADGRRLVTGGSTRRPEVWDTETLTLERTLPEAHAEWVIDVAASSDGRRLATGGQDGSVVVWDAERWEPLWTLGGHDQCINRLVFSADGTRLATGGDDARVVVWNVARGDALLRLRLPASIQDLAFAPDGRTLAVVYAQTVDFYPLELPPADLAAADALSRALEESGLTMEGSRVAPRRP